MDLDEVLGIRRSIRYFDPDRPVEREKIQKILEAIRIAATSRVSASRSWKPCRASPGAKHDGDPTNWPPSCPTTESCASQAPV